jgi:hypothetical protein
MNKYIIVISLLAITTSAVAKIYESVNINQEKIVKTRFPEPIKEKPLTVRLYNLNGIDFLELKNCTLLGEYVNCNTRKDIK